MVDILPGLLNQVCTYWAPSSTNEYGRRTYAAAIELPCQWENTTQVLDSPEGKQLTITATVFLSQAVEKDGILMLTALSDAPATPDETYRIKQVLSFQDIDNDEQLWKALL